MYYYKQFKGIDDFKRCFTDDELRKFFSLADQEMDQLFFRILFLKGKRIGELCPLNIRDFDFGAHLFYCYIEKKRSGCHRRIVYMDPDLENMIKEYIKKNIVDIQWSGGFLFYLENGNRGHKNISAFARRFAKIRQIMGLDHYGYIKKNGRMNHYVRPHTFRATAINKILRATNGDVFKTMSFSQHGSVQALLPYIEEYNRQEMGAIENTAFKDFRQQKLTVFIGS